MGRPVRLPRKSERTEIKLAFNPVLLDTPAELETERLLSQAPKSGDGAVFNASVLETLDDLRRYPASMIWAMNDQAVSATEEFVRRGAANWIIRADFPFSCSIGTRACTPATVGFIDSTGVRACSRSALGVDNASRARES